jgi:hypothetical protein
MKSDHVLIIIYVLMGIGAIIYFTRGVSVDPEQAFTGEDELRLQFNPDNKRLVTLPHKEVAIDSTSEAFTQLRQWFDDYDGKWYKTDQEYPNASVTIRGSQLFIRINRYEVSIAYNNAKGYLHQYRTNCYPCGFDFLWDLHEK